MELNFPTGFDKKYTKLLYGLKHYFCQDYVYFDCKSKKQNQIQA